MLLAAAAVVVVMFTAVQLAFLGSEETPLFTLAHEIMITPRVYFVFSKDVSSVSFSE